MDAQNRRRFLATLSSAGAAGLTGATASFSQDALLEITSIRIAKNSTICIAPQYIADDLLRAEGFTDIQYLDRAPSILSAALGRGEVDFSLHLSAPSIVAIDAGDRIALIAGVHVGCLELFATASSGKPMGRYKTPVSVRQRPP
jgi:NitT/TauT family transport system substrate-binding protein